MKKLLLFILFVAISFSLFAQDDEFENYSFDDNQITEKAPYFALSIGGTLSFSYMKYDDINTKPFVSYPSNITWEDAIDDKFSGPITCWGFDFFTALSPLLNNFRLGISYESGSKSIKASDMKFIVFDESFNITRKLSVNSTGLHFDYAWVPVKSLAILPGIGVKFGSMSLEQYATLIPAYWDGSGKYNLDINEKIDYIFMAFEPKLNIEYALTNFLMLRGSASYMVTIDNPFYENAWTINGDNQYSGVPSSVKPQGFSASLGIFIGLFNY